MTRCDYKKLGCSNDGLVIGVEWMCVKHIASQRALIEQQAQEIERLKVEVKKLNRMVAEDASTLDAECRKKAEEIARLREALRELHALVKGECPSLLDDDSGGLAHLDIAIDELLKEEHP